MIFAGERKVMGTLVKNCIKDKWLAMVLGAVFHFRSKGREKEL